MRAKGVHKKILVTGTLYMVICQYRNGNWSAADFWSKQYCSTSYLEAIGFRNAILAIPKTGYWTPRKFAIVKIAF
jgi:hypothetical protein